MQKMLVLALLCRLLHGFCELSCSVMSFVAVAYFRVLWSGETKRYLRMKTAQDRMSPFLFFTSDKQQPNRKGNFDVL